MLERKENTLVKPITGILTRDKGLLDRVLAELALHFGVSDIRGEWRQFTHTGYYESEMGAGLSRCFVSFEGLVEAHRAAGFKSVTKEIEDKFRTTNGRLVNIDPGYIDSCKVVLITGKHGAHKIALSEGVWADMLLWYNKGWVALPWAFPDFRDGGYFKLLTAMRTKFKQQK